MLDRIKIISVLLIFICSLVFGKNYKEFYINQAIYTTLHIIDYQQTLNVLKNGYYELNPILGRKPTKSKIDTYFITVYLLNTGISYYLYNNHKNTYRYYMGFLIGLKSFVIYYNFSVLF